MAKWDTQAKGRQSKIETGSYSVTLDEDNDTKQIAGSIETISDDGEPGGGVFSFEFKAGTSFRKAQGVIESFLLVVAGGLEKGETSASGENQGSEG